MRADVLLDRRGFALGLGASLFFGAAHAGPAMPRGERRLRLGVLSDIHFGWDEKAGRLLEAYDERIFLHALEHFRQIEVDGVVVAGDLTNNGIRPEFDAVAAAWRKVFPSNRGAGGKEVVPLFIRGNHDIRTRSFVHCWEKLFGSPADARVWQRDIGGYRFVCINWAPPGVRTGLKEFLSGNPPDGSRPFFVVQHPHPKSTVFGEWAWGHDDGETTEALAAYPNAFAISGHSHYPLTDDRTLWQGAFTSYNAGSLRYHAHQIDEFETGFENSVSAPRRKEDDEKMMPRLSCREHQGSVFDVYDDSIVISRRDFAYDGPIGEDLVVPLPHDPAAAPYAFERRRSRVVPPEFPAGAKLVAERTVAKNRAGVEKPAVRLAFPSAVGNASRVYLYAVTLSAKAGGPGVFRRIMAPDSMQSPKGRRFGKTVKCAVALADLASADEVSVEVAPVGFYGTAGRPVACKI